MNQATIREMIEQATPQERRQFRAIVNYELTSLRKRRKRTLEPEGEDHVNCRNDIKS